MSLRFLVPILSLFDSLRGERKTQVELAAETDKKDYSAFSIEHHRKYDGTFMLFGFSKEQKRPLLLAESTNIILAQQWAEAYDCLAPDVSTYTPCNICC